VKRQESVIVEAVGLARCPGSTNLRKDIRRWLLNRIVWILFRSRIPLAWRERWLIAIMRFRPHLYRRLGFRGASIGNTFENDLMKLVFQATAIADIADNDATSPLTNLQVSLHTADPGEAGDQTTSESAYTSYARVPVARTSGGWTVTNNSVSPAANIDFPAGTGGSGTVTHFAVGTASSGAGKVLFSGTVSPSIVTGNGVTPRLTTASAITLD
jgi:hypothetical protein